MAGDAIMDTDYLDNELFLKTLKDLTSNLELTAFVIGLLEPFEDFKEQANSVKESKIRKAKVNMLNGVVSVVLKDNTIFSIAGVALFLIYYPLFTIEILELIDIECEGSLEVAISILKHNMFYDTFPDDVKLWLELR